MRPILTVVALTAVALAGCTSSGDGATGQLSIQILDQVQGSTVELAAAGAWGLTSSDPPAWKTAFNNKTMQLIGTGEPVPFNGTLAAGDYRGIRLAFEAVSRDGSEATLVENGFDLPINFTVSEGATTIIELGFAWTDALFETQDGLAFRPALNLVRVVEGDAEVERLEAQDIEVGGTRPPVARMRVFDTTGLEVFESDFVAESRTDPVVGTGTNLTFAASASEALQPGAEIVLFEWDMGDGTQLQGTTVEHAFSVIGNQTVRLTVTDSAGGTDSQQIRIALKPLAAEVTHTFEYDGLVAAAATAGGVGAPIDHVFPIDATMTPDGLAGTLIAASVTLDLGHPGGDLDLAVFDGAGTEIGSSGNLPGSDESWRGQYPDGGPAGGDWIVQVIPYAAIAMPYSGVLEVTWNTLDADPDYLAWLAAYDDGHDHQH